MRGFCSATSINRRTLHRPGDVFICAEHPVAERCGNGVAVYFDFCLGTLMVTFVCAPSVEVFVHSSVCVCVEIKLGLLKGSLSQSGCVLCRLCLHSGSVRHREMKRKSEGASYAFSCPRRKNQMRG